MGPRPRRLAAGGPTRESGYAYGAMPGRKPVVTFDLDGVLCRPPFGINPGSLRERGSRSGTNPLLWLTERFRYVGRKPMKGAREGFRTAAELADCVVVTARGEAARSYTEGWLERALGVSPRLVMRPGRDEPSPMFKLRVIEGLGAAAHFEDDPNTAVLVAERVPVFLVDWPRNAGLATSNVHRVERIADALEPLRALLCRPA